MNKFDRIIIGAGAAGLFCAATADNRINGLIIDHSQRPGLKLLLSGSGQCNITHGGNIKDYLDHYGPNGKRIRSILYANNNLQLMEFIEKGGVPLMTRKDQKVFPKSLKASDILNLMLRKTEENGFDLHLNESVTEIKEGNGRYIITTDKGEYETGRLIIACGGKSYPRTGSDGSIYPLLSSLGIKINEPRPALAPIYVHKYRYKEISGNSFQNASVQLLEGNKEIASIIDDLLLTHKNFSGPAIINISRYAKPGMTMKINYIHPASRLEAEGKIKSSFQGNNRKISIYLSRQFKLPLAFCEKIAEDCDISPDKKTGSIEGEEITRLASALTEHIYEISGIGGFSEAMVTAGGVSFDEISPKTMEARNHPGLYFIGEVLDIDGDTGGYNLQFAYASAKQANKGME